MFIVGQDVFFLLMVFSYLVHFPLGSAGWMVSLEMRKQKQIHTTDLFSRSSYLKSSISVKTTYPVCFTGKFGQCLKVFFQLGDTSWSQISVDVSHKSVAWAIRRSVNKLRRSQTCLSWSDGKKLQKWNHKNHVQLSVNNPEITLISPLGTDVQALLKV